MHDHLAAVTTRAVQLELAIRGAVKSGVIDDGAFASALEDLSSEVVEGLQQMHKTLRHASHGGGRDWSAMVARRIGGPNI